jgi:hypothetical protein
MDEIEIHFHFTLQCSHAPETPVVTGLTGQRDRTGASID